ncbi:uncharacterized protein K452DRAFT_322408 [Aplosporella prunicola CBS 121167]|uniref:Smr domain-containing protein n=1 Tax=Aplosporella prunicola CBS 121167 TaxID=1176127 RepID=A0A6A6AX05_9PEZI|nr:uncharacterized protein K452DRAFT_322408 [Aplosporella prunicola CBS 121167]KAF2136459.1 hypothetical protein K452DRAFT_322408 [Aplosporella prunicola CBS 121167]
MQEHLTILEKDYCPPLDATIVYAIYHDYAGQENALELTRQLLEPLKANAVLEQQTDFDPSGSGGQAAFEPASSPSGRGDLSARSDDSPSACTSLSTAMSSLGVGENASPATSPTGSNDFTEYFQNLSGDAKQLQLMETFPTLKPFTIAHVLKKCKGDYSKATDELLNHALFEELDGVEGEEKIERKGIDSFAVDDAAPRGRKGKGKKKGTKYMNLDEYSRSSSEPAVVAGNKWQSAKENVGFISLRANISAQSVTSIYHKNGGSVSATILALIEPYIQTNEDAQADDPVVLQNSIDLTAEFPAIDLPHALALIRMTHPSSAAAHELAKALTATETVARPSGGIQIIPKYVPVDLSSPDSALLPRASSAAPASTPLGTTASAFSAARSAAFDQASNAFRRGKSDKLMKAVAGYYGEQGRELSRALKVASAQEADALVAAQSTPTRLDLHGVSVKDATRITRERVNAWWAGLGEARIKSYSGGRGGIGDGFTIITGKGRHNEDGKSKIGPAVGRMLMQEGWKYEAGSGELIVTGVARRS